MKGEKSSLWVKTHSMVGKKSPTDMNANEILGSTSMPVGTGTEPGGKAKAKYTKMEPTLEKVAGGDVPEEKGGASKLAKKDAYAGEMGGSAKGGGEKLSKMAQTVGKPRKGY